MRRPWLPGFGLATLLFVLASTAAAAPPTADTILHQVKQALEPAQSSLRKVTLSVTQDGETAKVEFGEARGRRGDKNHILIAVLAPADLRGTALLVKEEPGGPNDDTWSYIPAIRRVRKLVAPEAYSAFLNSEFTYSDLAFVSARETVSLANDETRDGAHVYVLNAVPKQTWYYSRIETTVAADTHLPIERRYFDPAGALWKVERWQGVSLINGIPTALSVTIEDVQTKSSSTMTITDLEYGSDVPEALLQPGNLPSAAGFPGLGVAAGAGRTLTYGPPPSSPPRPARARTTERYQRCGESYRRGTFTLRESGGEKPRRSSQPTARRRARPRSPPGRS